MNKFLKYSNNGIKLQFVQGNGYDFSSLSLKKSSIFWPPFFSHNNAHFYSHKGILDYKIIVMDSPTSSAKVRSTLSDNLGLWHLLFMNCYLRFSIWEMLSDIFYPHLAFCDLQLLAIKLLPTLLCLMTKKIESNSNIKQRVKSFESFKNN